MNLDNDTKAIGDSTIYDEEIPAEVEVPLLSIKEVFVYRVPPLKTSSGHRAEEWGLENPALTGQLKISRTNHKCYIKLYQPPKEGEFGGKPLIFGTCRIMLEKGRFLQHFVEHVMDSSRYFVLRCEDEERAGRVAYVGIGFRERSTAFDFKAALDDFVRSEDRERKAARLSQQHLNIEHENEDEKLQINHMPMPDLSLHEGQKIHLNLPLAGSSARRRSKGENKGGILIPPPKSGDIQNNSQNFQADEWGEFATA